jgi:hypothetical protein
MNTRTRTTAHYWLALALAGAAMATAVAMGTAHTSPTLSLPPCATEDSVSCYWDGPTMGNGHGRSYTVDADGSLTYTDCPPAHAYRADGTETAILSHTCQLGK